MSRKDDWRRAERKDLAKKARSAKAAGEPNAPRDDDSYKMAHKRGMEQQLRGFQKTGGGVDALYERTFDFPTLSRAVFGYEPSDLVALQNAQEGIESDSTMVERIRKEALERGGDLLRRAWPLYDLLSMLPDSGKAEELRTAVKNTPDRKGKYTITLTASEYAHLTSELKEGKGKA